MRFFVLFSFLFSPKFLHFDRKSDQSHHHQKKKHVSFAENTENFLPKVNKVFFGMKKPRPKCGTSSLATENLRCRRNMLDTSKDALRSQFLNTLSLIFWNLSTKSRLPPEKHSKYLQGARLAKIFARLAKYKVSHSKQSPQALWGIDKKGTFCQFLIFFHFCP